MYVKLTTQEKLKDLRVARHLTLKELEAAVGISSSTLGEYENNDYKDITSHSQEVLSKFYGVSIDYLLGITENDICMQTIKASQLSEEDFFGTTISKDLMEILSAIRDAHVTDSTTTDSTGADMVKNALDQTTHFEGSAEEAKVAMFLGQLGIKYNKLTKDEFVILMGILRKSDLLKSPGSKRGKGGKKRR